jgi:hypothetical protein
MHPPARRQINNPARRVILLPGLRLSFFWLQHRKDRLAQSRGDLTKLSRRVLAGE